ncbi:protein SRC2 homolog [Diospyros lotus]|uniref:protein SRC2 homolog n=1 Tax=Diospyros lotus TaxID=55363 RepID=UPI00225A246D|nr:protein SRC2 homolog [Diospyros lotus]
MEYRPLDITVMSADDLKAVNLISKMKAYVEVSLGGDPRTKRRTRVDDAGGNNPRWNDRISFPIEAAALNNLYLVFDIKSKRALGDRDVGRVTVPLKELFDAADAQRTVEYQVRRPSGKPRGTLRVSYKFGDKIAAPTRTAGEPVTAYPAHVGASTAYPPPSGVGMAVPYAHPAGHGYPPQPAYGYPPPPPYGYAPPVVQAQPPPRKKRGNFGLGLGAGLLGGLLVGDMISDAGDMGGYDYDAGFGDAGFDF